MANTIAFFARNGLVVGSASLFTVDTSANVITLASAANLALGSVTANGTTINVGSTVSLTTTTIKNNLVSINTTALAVGSNVVANATHVTANLAVFTSNVSVGQLLLPANTYNYITATGTNGSIIIKSGATVNAIFVANSGSVGIGTSPADNFHVQGNIVASGDVTTSYSDIRLKDHLFDIENVIDKIKTLQAFAYVPSATLLKLDPDQSAAIRYGISAQAVQSIYPDIVSIAPFDRSPDGTSKSGENYLTLDYIKFIPILLQAIKELDHKIDVLQLRMDTLEKEHGV